MKRNFLVWVFLPGFFAVLSSAQTDVPRGVARISLIQGDVSAQRGDTGDWAAAALNQPLVIDDRISTGDGSQTELQLDHSNILRLGNNTQAKIATLAQTPIERTQIERAQIQVQVGQGLAYYTFFKDSEAKADVEIDTPNAAIRPTSNEGVYRIEVHGFETQVIVRAGAADISTPQGSTHVEVGQAATVRGTTDEAGSVLGIASSRDGWDSWNNDRDGEIRNAQSWNYTNRYYVGSEDLDAYGHWINVPDYGRVWSPTVAAGWSPYRAGRWVAEPYWGWTWVSREPWGWTPYHYGRWFLYGKSWVWWPGPVDGDGNYRPDWAPAYVSFFGFGGRRGVSAGFGSVGWLPIGPGDSFYPWYGTWYGQNGSQSNVDNITGAANITKLNRGVGVVAPLRDDDQFSNVRLAAVDVRIRKAISTVPADRFGTGRSAPETVSRRAFRDARIITGNLPIVPSREALSATNRPASPSSISMMSGGRPERFFTKRQPAAAPQFLDRQAAQIQAPTQEGIQGNGAVVPVREVTQLDSVGTARPMPRPMPLEDGIERTVELTKDAQSGHGSRSQSGRDLRATPTPTPRTSRSTRRMMAQAPASRGAKQRTASRSGGSPHTALFSSVPATTSTRRMMTPATGSRGASARAAQSYIDSANRQMDKGNYTAAIANYKRAWQVDGNSSAAKARMERARRAMQAENKILADRR
jgi:FecR protein